MARVPRLTRGRDLRSFPLSPSEAYLLSRIDGVIHERDLANLTGIPAADVKHAIDRMLLLGAIELVSDPSAAEESREEEPPSWRGRELGGGSPPLYDPAELDEDVELTAVQRRRILDLYYRLEDLTYYTLLGVTEADDKKVIKSAYYKLAPEFHPDTYFRKRLGSYKTKIEAIFGRITLAQEVLTSRQRRTEYDAYLEQTHKNRAMTALIEQAPRTAAAVSAAVDLAANQALGTAPSTSPGRYASSTSRPPPADSSPTPVDVGRSIERPVVSVGPKASSPPAVSVAPAPSASPEELERTRRETLARKLRAPGREPAPRSVAPPPSEAPPASARPKDPLKERYDSAVADAKRAQVQRYLDLGRGALERKDHAAAANAYRVAASLAPDNPEVQATCEEAMRLASEALAEGYLKQARYEEGQGRWTDAALSYSRVCAGMPKDPHAHERVAFATLKAGASPRRAVEFARKAVELDPTSPEIRITLARAYAAAGLERSAAGELDRASQLAPNDTKIKALVAEARAASQRGDKVG